MVKSSFTKKKSILLIFIFFFSFTFFDLIFGEPFWYKKPPTCGAYSTFSERVLNRKHVYQLVVENFDNKYSLTLLVHHPKPWGRKSKAHPLYIIFSDIKRVKELFNYLDKYLESGYNLKIWLEGSRITKIYFFRDNKFWYFHS
jgi:hypothetical protein